MKKIIYVKYNRERKKEYQNKTCIYEENGEKYVEKSSLFEEGKQHLKSFVENYELIHNMNKNVKYLKPNYEKESVVYPYIEGKYFDNFIQDSLTNVEELIVCLQKFSNCIYDINKEYYCQPQKTEDFKKVFGDVPMVDGKWILYANIDLNINNIVFLESEAYCFDYEWIFKFPIPLDYIIYRNILLFYYKYGMYINNRISLAQLLVRLGFNEETSSIFSEMEKNMIKYVNEPFYYIDNYKKSRRPIKQIIENERVLRNLSEEQTSKIIEKDELVHFTEEKSKELEERISQLEKKIAELGEFIEKQETEIYELDTNKNDMLLQIEKLLEDKTKKETTIAYLEGELISKQQYINSFVNSRLYKIYKFLRLNKIIKILKGEK